MAVSRTLLSQWFRRLTGARSDRVGNKRDQIWILFIFAAIETDLTYGEPPKIGRFRGIHVSVCCDDDSVKGGESKLLVILC